MKPILFSESATTYTTNGIGRLSDAISCKVTEERNGMYELEMEVPETGTHVDEIGINSIIAVNPSEGASLQPFRVYKITKPVNGRFSVYAQHISYQLSHIPCMPFSVNASTSACASALNGFKNNAVESCPFTFQTDVRTVSSYTQISPASIRSRLGGVEGSILDQFGGEYEWDGYTVKLHAHRGVQTPSVTLRYGKDIIDLNQEENIANTITGIVPFWADSEGSNIVTLPEKVVESSTASNFPYKRTVVYDFSSEWENAPTVSQLRSKAQAYINKTGIGIPDVSIKVSFVHLADTEEYKDIAPLQTVKLCDIVGIEFEKYGISTTAKVVKTVYDVLTDRYESIEIGSIRTNLASTLSDTNSSIQGLANSTQINFAKMSNSVQSSINGLSSDLEAEIKSTAAELQQNIDNATAWLTDTGGVIRALKNAKGEWTDLLCMSTTATATSGNVLRLNSNGIGFSSNGWNGTYTQAWTLDGRLVIGGTNVPSITVYDNSGKVIFQADANKMVWNATNSSMSSTGVITATGAKLTNVEISGGKIEQSNYTRYGTAEIAIENGIFKSQISTNYYNGATTEVGLGSIKGYSSLYPNDISNILMYGDSDGSEMHLISDEIWITPNKSLYILADDGGHRKGHTGSLIDLFERTDLEYVGKSSDITASVTPYYETISDMLYNVVMESYWEDGHQYFTGMLQSWNCSDLVFLSSVGVTLSGGNRTDSVLSYVKTVDGSSVQIKNGIITT